MCRVKREIEKSLSSSAKGRHFRLFEIKSACKGLMSFTALWSGAMLEIFGSPMVSLISETSPGCRTFFI